MKAKKSIAILGIGGVGGYIGAKLSLNREEDLFRLVFIARGTTYKTIQSSGLHFSSEDHDCHLEPDYLQYSGAEEGPYDLVLLATKAPALKEAVMGNKALFSAKTLVVPLQNMVDAASQVRPLVGEAEVLDACIYLISNVQQPGHVKHLGGPGKIVAGKPKNNTHQWFFDALQKARIPVEQTDKVAEYLWKKFLFISSLGALTAAYEVTFGEILKSPALLSSWRKLMEEIVNLAQKHQVALSHKDINEAQELIRHFPEDARSSFQLDVGDGHFGEKKTLIDDVIAKSLHHGLSPETYELMESLISQNIRKNAGFGS
ncbi:ketopantoate reductase family protein [Cyclobacterium sp. SYSU L10401]|uniref:ketopantoate reductase family protein n=1 Tax=Cyclobacterium sp. SYSU L10401 TaxID=2678657 RepID=UPI0013D30D5D|nr:2-dehydropantoate 2-reductase [Cyclobacterium sp. SYSU L10401]